MPCRKGVAPMVNRQVSRSTTSTAVAGSQTSRKTAFIPSIGGMSRPKRNPVMWVTGDGMNTVSARSTAQMSMIDDTS